MFSFRWFFSDRLLCVCASARVLCVLFIALLSASVFWLPIAVLSYAILILTVWGVSGVIGTFSLWFFEIEFEAPIHPLLVTYSVLHLPTLRASAALAVCGCACNVFDEMLCRIVTSQPVDTGFWQTRCNLNREAIGCWCIWIEYQSGSPYAFRSCRQSLEHESIWSLHVKRWKLIILACTCVVLSHRELSVNLSVVSIMAGYFIIVGRKCYQWARGIKKVHAGIQLDAARTDP